MNLSKDILSRIQALASSLLTEVEPKTTEEYLESYIGKTNEYIIRDLTIREQCLVAYQNIISNHPEFKIEQKIDTYKVLLLLTMGMPDLSTIKYLTKEQIFEINKVFEQTVLQVIRGIRNI